MKTAEGPTMAVAAERGIWSGQFHERNMGVIGLLDCGCQQQRPSPAVA
jgi:hypothetical protein